MKTIILVTALVVAGIAPVLAQSVVSTEPNTVERLFLCQAGQGQLSEGIVEITLDNSMSPDSYYVSVTPIGSNAGIYLVEKTDKSFTLKSDDYQNVRFDYLVILKITKHIPSEKKME